MDKLHSANEHGQHHFKPVINEGFKLAHVRYQTTCDVCGEAIIAGEACYRKKTTRWQHQHTLCRE